MNWIKRLFKKRELIPLNWGQEDCPTLSVGDTLVGITENESWDYIAGFCRMNPKIEKGLTRKWKVKEILKHGSHLIECGGNRAFLEHMTWDDGNRVTVKANLAWSEKKIRWFKEVWH
jgi:hypothetical protein